MTTEPAPGAADAGGHTEGPFFHGPSRHDVGLYVADGSPGPTTGMVLHRVLARSARAFLLNDMSDELVQPSRRYMVVGAAGPAGNDRPLWARTANERHDKAARRSSEIERIHQSRVALRRIRSTLRTFRLAVDPAWGTTLRAELAWYSGRLGDSRDLHVIEEMIGDKGPRVTSPANVDRLEAVVAAQRDAVLGALAAERGGARRFQLTEQMMVLWDGPHFSAKADLPAGEALTAMVRRAWHDLRGAARTARKQPTEANLHALRIRLKDLRYGCETVALVEGGPARKTAKAAERLQTKLGDLHDARRAVDWLRAVGADRPELAEPVEALVALERETASAARKGWKRDLKEVERRWRNWQG
jgi:CHAD domain-containing protein